jgi:hypothetical protein
VEAGLQASRFFFLIGLQSLDPPRPGRAEEVATDVAGDGGA